MRRFVSIPLLPPLPARAGRRNGHRICMIAGGIAGVLVATITTLGGSVNGLWTAVASALN